MQFASGFKWRSPPVFCHLITFSPTFHTTRHMFPPSFDLTPVERHFVRLSSTPPARLLPHLFRVKFLCLNRRFLQRHPKFPLSPGVPPFVSFFVPNVFPLTWGLSIFLIIICFFVDLEVRFYPKGPSLLPRVLEGDNPLSTLRIFPRFFRSPFFWDVFQTNFSHVLAGRSPRLV